MPQHGKFDIFTLCLSLSFVHGLIAPLRALSETLSPEPCPNFQSDRSSASESIRISDTQVNGITIDIEIDGSTIYSEEDFRKLIAGVLEKMNQTNNIELNPDDVVTEVAAAITTRYVKDNRLNNRLTSRARFDLKNEEGVYVIRVDEKGIPIPNPNIQIYGSTIYSKEDFDKLIAVVLKEMSLDGSKPNPDDVVKKVAEAITDRYVNGGYINSQAINEPKNENGVYIIQIYEGRLAEVGVQAIQPGQENPSLRISRDYICQRIQLGAGIPLNINKLEDQLRLLHDDPLFDNVEASLKPTGADRFGESRLDVGVIESRIFTGSISFDNFSPPSVGSEQASLSLNFRNLSSLGDYLTLFYTRSRSGGLSIADVGYSLPLNPMNGTLQLHTAVTRSLITQSPFEQFNITADSQVYDVGFRQPLIRKPNEEFALTLGFSYRDGQTFLFDRLPTPFGFGPDDNGVSRTSIFKFTQDYLSRDQQGAWSFRSQFSLGTGLLSATINQPPLPDSRFVSWLGQFQRVQRIDQGNHLLIFQFDIQLTPDSLLPSEQFVLGGGQNIRGYRQNIRSGDNGFRFAVEDRIAIQRNAAGIPTLQLIPSVNLGSIWNSDNNPNPQPSQNFLVSVGMGVLWNPVPNITIRVDYAPPIINLDDRGGNIQDNGLYFSAGYSF